MNFEELVQRGRAGDQEAIGLLLSGYRGYMMLIANQDLEQGLRSKLGASDVVQETLMLAQKNFQQFRGESEQELRGWLRSILVNDLKNNRRQYSSRKRNTDIEVNLNDHSAVRERLVDPLLTPSSDAMQKERARVLSEALQQLSEDHQAAIRLRIFEQLNFVEIGERMNRSPDAARKLWARAIESLENQLATASPDLLSGFFETEQQGE